MAQTKLVFTCLPDPAAAGGPARVSVAVAPRLQGAGAVLADWTDFAALPWPEVLQSMPNPIVEIGGLVVEATLAPPRRAAAALDPDAWSAVFAPGTPVVPYVYDRDTRPIRSFGAHEVSDRMRALYREVALLGG